MNCLIQRKEGGWIVVYNGCGAAGCQIPPEEQSGQYQIGQMIQVPCA